jgi:hypothetical protein
VDHDAMKIAVLRARIHELEEALASLTFFADNLACVASSIAGIEPIIKEAVWAYHAAKGETHAQA